MKFDGFYTAYMTGGQGTSLALFCFKDGVISGVDIGGGKYSGTYSIDQVNNIVLCHVRFVLKTGNTSITGMIAESADNKVEVDFNLPIEIDPKRVFEMETPIGPINARFELNAHF